MRFRLLEALRNEPRRRRSIVQVDASTREQYVNDDAHQEATALQIASQRRFARDWSSFRRS